MRAALSLELAQPIEQMELSLRVFQIIEVGMEARHSLVGDSSQRQLQDSSQ
jgi:hypothetical protein